MFSKFHQTFLTSNLSFEFKAYLPSYSLPPRNDYLPRATVPIVMVNGTLRSIDYAHWGFFPEGYELSFGPRPDRRCFPFARAEQISNSRLFARSIQKRRWCLVPATATAFVYRAREGRTFHVSLGDNLIFAFGGLWTETPAAQSREEKSFSILTVPAVRELTGAERMPLCLTAPLFQAWIEGRVGVRQTLAVSGKYRFRVRPE